MVTFAILYSLSPKTFMADVPFAPIPYALAFYAPFTFARLVLAYRRGLPGWVVALSVVVDIGLLLLVIWSVHLQYRQTASFSLKAPALLYVFIFIALRALRFEARYLLLAGAVAVAGWGLMVLYVITVDSENPMITHNYITYMTENSVLLGAEFDKMVSIGMVTMIPAFAIARSRRLLTVAVSESIVARELKRFFDPEIAERIALDDYGIRPGQGVTRDAAILTVDVRGFSSLVARVSPDELVRLLTESRSRLVPVIGDTVNQAAKLEKHNKAEGATALTSAACYELVLAQGYRPDRPGERRPGRAVGGLDEPIDLVVLA